MLLAYCKQIIQNQRKTVGRAVTINVCWRKSSCELFSLATTHAKLANSGSGKQWCMQKISEGGGCSQGKGKRATTPKF